MREPPRRHTVSETMGSGSDGHVGSLWMFASRSNASRLRNEVHMSRKPRAIELSASEFMTKHAREL
jgi:hypothetical protein